MLVLHQNAHRPAWRTSISRKHSLLIDLTPACSAHSLPEASTAHHAAMADLPNGTCPSGEHTPPITLTPSDTATDLLQNNQGLNGSPIGSTPISNIMSPEADGDINPYDNPGTDHVIRLSGIEHSMPRSYIRICLAYPLPSPEMLTTAVEKLNHFVRKTVDAKPYLSGYVVAVDNPGNRVGAVEIRFSDTDFLEYPDVNVRHLTREEVPYTYTELLERDLPPSVIKPDLVSALGESADEDRAPVFRVQANVVEGGLIVSVYLHHCISDGTGAGLLISGSLLNDTFTFNRHLDGGDHDIPDLSMRLNMFANQMSVMREELSYGDPNQVPNRALKWKSVHSTSEMDNITKPIGRGCVFAIPLAKLKDLKDRLQAEQVEDEENFMSTSDVLMTLIWHSMTKARVSSISGDPSVTRSKLLIPVNIRKKLTKPLSDSYFGAAIDWAAAELPLCHLVCSDEESMSQTALTIRQAIKSVTEPYIRQLITLATHPNSKIDVRDLQASNMDRANGADMYITSWRKLNLYESDFEMELGCPDWVRKPWSRDPGSCIVLPSDDRKDFLEVVIQMTEADMARLLGDMEFMGYVKRWIE